MKNSKVLLGIGSIILLLILAGGVYFLGRFFSQPASSEHGLAAYLGSKRQSYIEGLSLSASSTDKIIEVILQTEDDIKKIANDYQKIVQVGVLYQRLHEYDLARSRFEQAIQVLPGEGLAYANLAELYVFNFKDFNAAAENYKKAVELDYWKVDNYKSLSDLYRSQFPEKKSEIEGLMLSVLDKSNGNDLAVYTYLMEFFWDEGNLEKALEYDKKAIKVAPDNDYLKQSLQKLQKELAQ